MTIRYDIIESPIGDVLLVGAAAAQEPSLAGVYLSGQRYEPAVEADWQRDRAFFSDAANQLAAYFAGELTDFGLPVVPAGTPFQQSVWRALPAVEFGTTRTYGEIAERVADRTKTRAVAAAIGRNPACIVIPCHRIVGADGSLTGYAGGLERKKWLLDHEARARRAASVA
jgi:methylated-DNA-[protein]-cysteine S-methyltransferase